jgi:hypothetical protein
MATDAGGRSTSGKAIASLILGLLSFCIPFFAGLVGVILGFLSLGEIKRSGGQVGGKGLAIGGIIASFLGTIFSCGAILVYGGFKSLQAVHRASEGIRTTNNLKMIGLAMHNYNDAHGSLPGAAKRLPNGSPGLSWRVQLLPYLEEDRLYLQFHHDEPWDSPHNKTLMAKMPAIYARSGENALGKTTTPFQVFVGRGTPFEDRDKGIVDKGIGFADITDGSSNTWMVVESQNEVPWTKPEDLPFDPAMPLPALGVPGRTDFFVVTCDGAAHRLPKNTDERTLKGMITRNGGELINMPW